MCQSVQHVTSLPQLPCDAAILAQPRQPAVLPVLLGLASLMLWPVAAPVSAQTTGQTTAQPTGQTTGPQQLAFAGLRAGPDPTQPSAQINAVRVNAQGDLYLLVDQKDGVRLIETDAAASTVLAQAQVGAKGDIGLAMALDPAGNVYIAGTTTSGALAANASAAFPNPSGAGTNSFIARFDPSLNLVFLTFAGGNTIDATAIAATSDAVFVTGSIFAGTLPVTPAGILQAPAYNSTQNGFVEKFSAAGTTLLYATYLTGASGATTPSAIAADSSDHAYIAGTTTSPGYPTLAALVPNILGATSGFLTELTPAGDGIVFSTYLPGGGISSLALDPIAGNLLLSGTISLGQFPVVAPSLPLTATAYQVLLRLSLDGSTVLGSTVLAAGTQSFVAPGVSGSAWVVGSLGLPLLPLTPLSSFGNSFAVHVDTAGAVDQTARFGGLASSNPSNASAPVALTSLAVDSSGNPILAGSFDPSASQAMLATETYDLPLAGAPTSAFPSTVRSAVLPVAACNGSLCPGSAAYLAKLAIPATPAAAQAALALSIDDAPNLILRNLATAEATGLQVTVTGFTSTTDCGPTLPAGGECNIEIGGNGPGTIAAAAANAFTQTFNLPALPSTATAIPIAFSPRELDFGVVSSASGTVTRTVTVTNLTQQSQTFVSRLDTAAQQSLAYTLSEASSDCALAGAATKLLAPGGVCHIALGLTASNNAANDGPVAQNWLLGTRDVQITGYVQAAALSLSSAEVDFGTLYTGGLRTPRYLYLSNNSTTAVEHALVTLPATAPFALSDACPSLLEPLTICQLQLNYQPAHTPSADSVTLSLDNGLTALVTGRSLPKPSSTGASVNPYLSVSTASLAFANAVAVTGVSGSTQSVTLQNTGASAFTLALALTGDFTDTTNCGATLAGGASCSVVLTFVPSQPGARQGLLSVTAGAATTPAYVALSGVGTAILSPANNGTLNFGGVIVGQPTVLWYRITQPFTSLSVATSGAPYTAILVEDLGFGHGEPAPAAFTASSSSACLNCWLGVQFTPTSTGPQAGTLTLTSATAGSPYVLALAGSGLPLTGLLLTPVSQDFGPVPVNSSSGPGLFTVTNLVAGAVPIVLATPAVTGDFAIAQNASGGASCGGSLAYTASCFVEVAFSPTATGPRTGTLTVQAGGSTASAALTGYGSPDPGLALSPTALVFGNVPGTAATVQTVTLANTGSVPAQVGLPSTTTAFAATSTCGTLAPGAACTIGVAFTPQSAPAAGTLTIPVTTNPDGVAFLTTYAVPLTGAYTTQNAGLQIVPAAAEYGPQATGAMGATLQFSLNNLTAKSLAIALSLPRQFVLAANSCATLAASASCSFSVSFLPLDNGDSAGTMLAQATPADASTPFSGLGYIEGYGVGPGTIAITGALQPTGVLDFGQVPSGQSSQRTLTLTNSSATRTLTIRRISGASPFLATTTCGQTLPPSTSCTVALAYTPINQVVAGSSSVPTTDNGTLTIESDAASSPNLVDLTGSSTPVTVSSPSNTAALPALTLSQSSLAFPSTPAGSTSAPQTVTLTNTGTANLTVSGMQTSTDFTFANTCTTLLPGASCNVAVSFTPQPSTLAGARASALEIGSNAPAALEFVSLTGLSTASALAVSPISLSFGSVLAGSTATQAITLSNTGSAGVNLASISATGDFAIASSTCPAAGTPLAAGTSCTAHIAFTPTQSGTRSGVLTIVTSSPPQTLTVPLSGTGSQPQLQIAPSSLAFGTVNLGSSASLSLTLTNTGNTPIANLALTIAGDYAIAAPCPVTTLAALGSCSVTIAFTPAAAGPRPGSLTIASSDPASPASVALTGTGAAPASFTLTVNGGSSAAATVASGTPATYNLAVAPANGFTGAVVLNCTPVVPAAYAACSLLPSSVTLAATPQSSVATISTLASVAFSADPVPRGPGFLVALCLLLPPILVFAKGRGPGLRAGRAACIWLGTCALLCVIACGGKSSGTPSSNVAYAPPGSYQYQVTASSVAAGVPIAQTVTLNLTVQ